MSAEMKLYYGAVTEQDLSGPLALYRVTLTSGLLSPWLAALTTVAGADRYNHALSVGTQVALLFGTEEGLILGALNSAVHPATTDNDQIARQIFNDGAVIEYNAVSHQLNAVLPASATTALVSDGGIHFTGDLLVEGNITASGDVTDATRSMAGDRGIYNGHTHTDPQGGSVLPTGQKQ